MGRWQPAGLTEGKWHDKAAEELLQGPDNFGVK
jgi:hypothetical protein